MGIITLFMSFSCWAFALPLISVELNARGFSLMRSSGVLTVSSFFGLLGIMLAKKTLHLYDQKVITSISMVLVGFGLSLMGPSDWFHYPDDTYLINIGMVSSVFFSAFTLV